MPLIGTPLAFDTGTCKKHLCAKFQNYKDGWTALMKASEAGHMECVQVLLDRGTDVNKQTWDGGTALMKASEAGHIECVQVLLDKGADVNMQNKDGGTALMKASEAGHIEYVQVLLDKGADINMQNKRPSSLQSVFRSDERTRQADRSAGVIWVLHATGKCLSAYHGYLNFDNYLYRSEVLDKYTKDSDYPSQCLPFIYGKAD
ncbi:hypothetical protein EMCRGX_G006632 [Ephydatia muelleri]